jgi:glycosyltransferase involved in cell wall biosynthesis
MSEIAGVPAARDPASSQISADPPLRLLLLYWGRRGFPVRLVDDFTRQLRNRRDLALALSMSRQSEGFADADTSVPSFHVDTFAGRASALTALLRLPRQRRDLMRFLQENGTEVIFMPMRHAFLPLVRPPIRRAGVRVLMAVHDALPHPGDSYPLWRRHFRLELAATDGILVMSDYVAEQMARVYRYPRERTFRMPLPSPAFGAPRRPRTAPTGRPWRLMFFGRFRAYKGLSLLAEAYAALRGRFAVTLRVVGEGDAAALGALAALPDVTIERRWVPEREVAALFDGTDVLVLPYAEASQSGVLATAFALGVPTVATPVGGLCEQIVSRSSGLLAGAATGPAIAEALAALLAEPDLYARCSAGALAAAAGPFDTGRAVVAVLDAARALRAMPLR